MKHLLLLPVLFTSLVLQGQTTISGKIIDQQGAAVPLANILLLDTYDGATSDANGNFTFTTTEAGQKILVVKFVGYYDFEVLVNLDGKPLSFTVSLKERINELKAVTISAGSFTASDEARRTVFKALDIATTAGATADIAGALNTLPGTQKVGESGRLFVRGGDGTETRTFIDGTVVLDAYSPAAPNTPSRGRFLPFMFKGTSFSTGGYSAEYGQALSSALVLESKDEVEMTRTDIGILSVGGDVGHTQAWKDGSVSAKLQYTNIRPYFGLINQRVDWKAAPVSLEGVTAFRQKVGKTGILKFYASYNQSDFSLYHHDIDDDQSTQLYELGNNYRYVNASYKTALNENWSVREGISYTRNANLLKIDGAANDDIEEGLHAKSVIEGSLSDHAELKTGIEVITRTDEHVSSSQNLQLDETISSAFAEADLYASNSFVTRFGLRSEYNNLLRKVSLDPRISMAYKVGAAGQVSVAYGKFRQTAKLQRLNRSLENEKAEHFIVNYQRIENDRTFRVEAYYKKYDDLVKYEGNLITNKGDGFAKGFELFWRDNRSIKNADYWISYSFLETERNYLSFPYSAAPAFASKHNLSVVAKYFITELKSQAGVTYSISSGRPYANPDSQKFHADRTPHYADLSFNWSYLPKPYLVVYFSCTNVLGRDNIFGYEYGSQLNEDGQHNRRAVRQPASRFIFLGIFITLSKEKSVNQLPVL